MPDTPSISEDPSRAPSSVTACRGLEYGAPPQHGGIAPGIDRIVMLLCEEENLREVVLFLTNQKAEDLLMGAPSEVAPKQLRELHIRLNLPQS